MTDAAPETPKKKSKLKTLIILVGMFVGEAALIIGAIRFLSPPAEVAAQSALDAGVELEEDKIVELLVVEGRFPNSKRGSTYLYDTEVYVQVKRRYQDQVSGELEQFRNEIKAELTAVWRTSEPRHFEEPKLENLTRKVYALMDERFGVDQVDGEPIIAKAIIVMGTGLRVEG